MRVCRHLGKLDDLTDEQIALSQQVMSAALAEVGVDPAPDPHPSSPRNFYFSLPTSDPRGHKARELAYIAAGIPYTWVEDEP